MPSGIIIKGIGGFYYVSSEDDIYECKARGIFRKDDVTPLTGDRVTFSVTDPLLKKGNIDGIMERTTVLTRPAAANIDMLVVVIAARSPDPDLLLLDKLLVTAGKKGIEAVICINKIDLDMDNSRAELHSSYVKAGYTVIETSLDECSGFERLRETLKGHVSVFAGQSGVGKSTLLNRMADSVIMQTGSISEKIDRGRHTTRHTELIKLADGGYIVDTPGFSSFELAQIPHDELQHLFPEFTPHIYQCRFTGCSHVNEPDCGVKEAVGLGSISRGRYQRYTELYAILKLQYDMKYKKTNRKGTKGND
ncbi:MAG: ribosome small subunit-dependent GTPase A [Clostridiaceae bacterium]|nr:ribosome small subunit-dependent GTPase A [Clostridiaceae bacterium]